MPRPLSTALRARIKADFETNTPIKTIITTYSISDKKARSMKKLYDACGEVWLPTTHSPAARTKRTGRPPKITPDHEARLRAYLADRPDAYIKDMCRFLHGACGTLVDESTMWRAVRRLGWQTSRVVKPKDARGFWVQTLQPDDDDNGGQQQQGRAVAAGPTTKKTQKQKQKQKHNSGTEAPDLSPAATQQLLSTTRAFVRDHLSHRPSEYPPLSQGWPHVQRVHALSMSILQIERAKYPTVTFSPTITELVALMHELHASSPSSSSYPSTPTPTIEMHLQSLGWPPHIAIPVNIISASIPLATEQQHPAIHLSALRRFPELAVVQDADRLDAMGAIGLGRVFAAGGGAAAGGAMGGTTGGMVGGGAIDGTMSGLGEGEPALQGLESVIATVEQLGVYEGLMKTGEGRRLAAVRAERLRIFKSWLGEEIAEAAMSANGAGAGEGQLNEDGVDGVMMDDGEGDGDRDENSEDEDEEESSGSESA